MEETAPETYNRGVKLADASVASRGKVWKIGIFRKLSGKRRRAFRPAKPTSALAPWKRRVVRAKNRRPKAAGSEDGSAFRGALAASARPVAFDKIF